MDALQLIKTLEKMDPTKVVIVTAPDGEGWDNIGQVVEDEGNIKIFMDGLSTTLLKEITPAAVLEAADGLIHAYGSTTTLHIKRRLRLLGYNATQERVSEIMDKQHTDVGMYFTDNGTYRSYMFKEKTYQDSDPEVVSEDPLWF